MSMNRSIFLALLVLTGCASETTLYSNTASSVPQFDVKDPSGPVYYLPYSALQIESGHCVVQDKPKAASSSAKKTSTTAAGTNINVNVKPTLTSTVTTAAGAKGPTKAPAKKCDPSDPNSPYGFRVNVLTLADHSEAYSSGFSLANFSSDEPSIRVSVDGLLTTVNVTSKDESRETIVKFGETVGTLAGLTQVLGLNLASGARTYDSAPLALLGATPKPSIKALCPVSSISATNICTASAGSPSLSATFVLPGGGVASNTATKCTGKCDGDYSGLLFRTQFKTPVQIEAKDAHGNLVASTTMVLSVVNPDATYLASAIRRPFVKSETSLIFNNGILTGIEGEYPSTGGAIVSLPADFIGSIFTGIGNALSFRSSTTNSETEYINAQVALIEAQAALAAAQRGDSSADDQSDE